MSEAGLNFKKHQASWHFLAKSVHIKFILTVIFNGALQLEKCSMRPWCKKLILLLRQESSLIITTSHTYQHFFGDFIVLYSCCEEPNPVIDTENYFHEWKSVQWGIDGRNAAGIYFSRNQPCTHFSANSVCRGSDASTVIDEIITEGPTANKKLSVGKLKEKLQPVVPEKCSFEFWKTSLLYALFGYFGT